MRRSIARLRNAGALVMGKTNIHELSFGWTSNNLAFGAVHNPYDPARIPGGSSGGTAAAIAARIAPLGVAEDTEGSIRVPAALCGIAGFRPTTGRYPTTGVVPISPLFDQIGPHARSVADLVMFDTSGRRRCGTIPEISLRGTRLGIDRSFFEGLDPDIERITATALKNLEAAGAVIVQMPVPELAKSIGLTTAQVQLHDVAPSLIRYLAQYGTNVSFRSTDRSRRVRTSGRLFQSFVPEGSPLHVSEAAYDAARNVHLPDAARNVSALVRRYRRGGDGIPDDAHRRNDDRRRSCRHRRQSRLPFSDAISRNIASGSTAGLPGLVLPTGLTRAGCR